MRTLKIEPLTRMSFKPFGDVIDAKDASKTMLINEGFSTRFHDLADIDTSDKNGEICVSIFRTNPVEFPFFIRKLERHPLGSQMFIPMNGKPYLVVVTTGDKLKPDNVRAFLASPNQGVNFAKNTWHHFSLSLEPNSDFLVIDRKGPGSNLEEQSLDVPLRLLRPDI